ncbi:WG repeat-containing protein [Bacillus sp. LK2]|uniref:WG repeat-containing protein n=1 Tax=Bacillus sp. LK2 TaxID=1628206 RepID=UPI000AD3421A
MDLVFRSDFTQITERYFIDTNGEYVLNCSRFHSISGFSEGLALVKVDRNGLYGFINKQRNIFL